MKKQARKEKLKFYNKNKTGWIKVSHDGIGPRWEGFAVLNSSDIKLDGKLR